MTGDQATADRHLVLTGTDAAALAAGQALVERALAAMHSKGDLGVTVQSVDRPGDVPEVLRTWPGAYLVVFYAPCAVALESALRAEADPAGACADWESRSKEGLTLIRRFRQSTVLIGVEAVTVWPAAVLEALGKWLGIPLDAVPADTDQPDPDPVLKVFARQLAMSRPSIRGLDQELLARALPLAEAEAGPDEDLVAALGNYRAAIRAQTQAEALHRDNAVLLERSGTVQRALQSAIKQRQILGQNLSEAETQRIRQETELRDARDQIHQTESRLRQKEEELHQTVRALRDELRLRQEEIDEFLSSRSWKITKPLRSVRLLFGRGQQKDR